MNRKTWVLLFGLIILSLSCTFVSSIFEEEESQVPKIQETISPSSSLTPTQRYVTSTPPQSSQIPKIEGTAIATGQIYGSDEALTDTKYTNEDGDILIVDENNKVSINIKVIDEGNGEPLPEILVHWVSYDDEFFVLAADLQGPYLPIAKTGRYEDLLASSGNFQPVIYDKSKFVQDSWEDVKIVINLMNGLEDINSLKGLAGYLADWPDIAKHAEFKGLYSDICMTGEQMANLASFSLMLIPGANVKGLEGEELLVPSIVAIGKHIIEDQAIAYLSSLEGRYRLRFYNIPIPLIQFFTYKGKCDETIEIEYPEIRDYSQIFLGDKKIFDIQVDARGCFSVGGVTFSPTNEHFMVVPHCLEGDNDAFIFNKDGSEKRVITEQWDYVSGGSIDWSPDGEWLIYQRVNAFGYDPPEAPPEGLVLYEVATGEKTLFYGTKGPPNYGYPTSPIWSPDGRWIAFLYVQNNEPIKVYFIAVDLSSQWRIDEFEYQKEFGGLKLGLPDDEQSWILNYHEVDEIAPAISYRISTLPNSEPPGTQVPLYDEPEDVLFQVVDVQMGDVLNIRAQPGAGYSKVGEIPFNGRDILVTGEGVMVGIRMWVPVDYGGVTGWVNSKFLDKQGSTD